jgi:predicted RecA/RadA family phage recombinase
MQNYVAPGEVLTLTTPGGGVVSGTAYKIGSLVVIATITVTAAQVTADATIKFTGLVCGVVEHAKVSAQEWTEGVKLYWDNSAHLFTTSTGGGNTLVGVASKFAANPSSTGWIRLDGVVR